MSIEVYISDECFKLVQSKATLPFDGGVKTRSGEWKCKIEESTFERLEPLMLKGETLSETIFRVLSVKN